MEHISHISSATRGRQNIFQQPKVGTSHVMQKRKIQRPIPVRQGRWTQSLFHPASKIENAEGWVVTLTLHTETFLQCKGGNFLKAFSLNRTEVQFAFLSHDSISHQFPGYNWTLCHVKSMDAPTPAYFGVIDFETKSLDVYWYSSFYNWRLSLFLIMFLCFQVYLLNTNIPIPVFICLLFAWWIFF